MDNQETKIFYDNLNKRIEIFNKKLNELLTRQYIITNISLSQFFLMKF